ncbi:MAG: hypothetical protein ACOWWO_14955 [Peptococcaceae bacterium]
MNIFKFIINRKINHVESFYAPVAAERITDPFALVRRAKKKLLGELLLGLKSNNPSKNLKAEEQSGNSRLQGVRNEKSAEI